MYELQKEAAWRNVSCWVREGRLIPTEMCFKGFKKAPEACSVVCGGTQHHGRVVVLVENEGEAPEKLGSAAPPAAGD